MSKRRIPVLLLGALFFPMATMGQQLKENYFEWWPSAGKNLPKAIQLWKNRQYSRDDHFFISRVKPKYRFRNAATQVDENLTEANDKRLIAWVPMNDVPFHAMPNGVFDSEVFNMWSYVDHWGDWNSPFGRVPATLLDVAHKNGVAVSSELGVPWNNLTPGHREVMQGIAALGAESVGKYLRYYGQNGLGYNSEFPDWADQVGTRLRTLHAGLNKYMKDKDPLFENIWYDGTNDRGAITFDRGLGNHNQKTFGDAENKATSLFFNYNWYGDLLQKSAEKAKAMGRSSFDLYAGFNMQGGDPNTWSVLARYPISIGLWGAHERNMFFESRNEQGSMPEVKQRTYLERIERWFTGGTRNPANTPRITNSMNYGAKNYNFHGMSKFMTAKSALHWDLAEEPFITYFNLGNGKFFNWNGQRANDNEWYNLGVQDYMPTWRWWFASSLLGKDVPESGLDAEFTWNDAYVGGSCMRVFGSTSGEYLHLFKTKYELKAGDVITVKYKLVGGSGDANLVLTSEGAEKVAVNEDQMNVLNSSLLPDDEWKTAQFTVDNKLVGKDLALVALHFNNADNLNLYLGEFSIVRGTAETPAQPINLSADIFAFNTSGVDGKLIFDMPNNKPVDEPCYNVDVKTSLFKIYSQQENGEKVLLGITNSWAAMVFSAPMDMANSSNKIRFGVSAASLDMKSESPIAWTEYMQTPDYLFSDEIKISQTVIQPNEPFTISYVDKRHPEATWELVKNGVVVATKQGVAAEFEGLAETGNYDLKLVGDFNKFNSNGEKVGTEQKEVVFPAYVSITGPEFGAMPKILTLTANGKESDLEANVNEAINFNYTGRPANATLSRAMDLKEKGMIFAAKALGFTNANRSWTLSFWVKFNSLPDGPVQFIDLRDQFDGWPWNNWGNYWSTYNPKTQELEFVIRGEYRHGEPAHQQTWKTPFYLGKWTHVAIAMEKGASGVREKVYIDGQLANAVRWNLGETKGLGFTPKYQNTKAWNSNPLFMIGIGRHGCAAMDAVVDDVRFFDTELNESDVEKVMKNNDMPNTQIAYWSFDKDPNEENWFANESTVGGNTKTVNIARVDQLSGEGEGRASFKPLFPNYTAGAPAAKGNAYKIETKAAWKASKGMLSNQTGNDQSGSATVKYPNGGEYRVTLTLENAYGKATRTFEVIKVNANTTGIVDTNVDAMKAYNVGKDVFVEFAETGKYTVLVYNANGMVVAQTTNHVVAGNRMHVNVAHEGLYVLKVMKDGKTMRVAKLLCK